jgi:hypothetical protein
LKRLIHLASLVLKAILSDGGEILGGGIQTFGNNGEVFDTCCNILEDFYALIQAITYLTGPRDLMEPGVRLRGLRVFCFNVFNIDECVLNVQFCYKLL